MATDLPDELAIRVDDVTKRFRLETARTGRWWRTLTGFHQIRHSDFWALKGVSVDVPKGSMLGIVGRNGSGKSTLLRIIAGVYRPSSGSVTVRGRTAALLELGAGFHQHLSGIENIYFNAAVHGLDRHYVDTVLDDIIALADIGSFIDNPLEVYSSGMRARLGFAVTVYLQPEVLMADEITAVGDVAFARRCMNHLERLRDEGVTIVLVSHNLGLIQRMSDQVMWLDGGEVRMLGEAQTVLAEYRDAMAVEADDLGDDEMFSDGAATGSDLQVETLGEEGDRFIYSGGLLELTAVTPTQLHPAVTHARLRFRHQEGLLPIESLQPVEIGDGGLSISCRVESLPLPPGHYGLVLALVDAEGNVLHGSRTPIRVRPSNSTPETGFTELPVAWQVYSAESV